MCPHGNFIADYADLPSAAVLPRFKCSCCSRPISKSTGGTYIADPDYMRGVRALCDKYGILYIADEA